MNKKIYYSVIVIRDKVTRNYKTGNDHLGYIQWMKIEYDIHSILYLKSDGVFIFHSSYNNIERCAIKLTPIICMDPRL